jgi:hypothetical protein
LTRQVAGAMPAATGGTTNTASLPASMASMNR